ncbi:SET and MYND domain-containing protein 4 [Eumeta japonica]|uniref:SET and MYND domain-containing protein 4 n=1 Tax=Eumeta variegata TaxID=151549 RepID=A0A4C1UJQ3_EUMVA|nr:SET and MYND domain-containing protein 4 [Eumeta japonica]
MWLNSQFFQHIFGYEALEDIYESLQNDDHTEVVMKLHEKLKHAPFEWHLEKKSVEKSDACRRQGNDAFKSHSYCQALIFYNRALCYAPKNSRSLILAYSNRSALLYELKEFKDALKDIKMCYQLGCPDDLVQKLKIREEKCYQTKRVNDFTESLHKIAASSHTLLTLGPSPSNEIPCASKMVKLDTSGVRPKVVASENIDVGTVVALETPFVNTFNSDLDAYRACYHCMKTSLNLIPCNNCCLVMFCAENCEKESLQTTTFFIRLPADFCIYMLYLAPRALVKFALRNGMKHL